MAEVPLTRRSLLLRLRDPHDEAAWTDFVDLYAPLVYGYARKQGLQDADAADLTQDVLGAVAGAVGRLEYDRERGLFRNWLFTVVRRKLSNWRRRERPRAAGVLVNHDRLLQQCSAPGTASSAWEDEWRQRTFAWACEKVRGEVSAGAWQAFWRTAIDGKSAKQAAAEVGMTLMAVYQARSRIRARLRELAQSVQEP